MRRRDKAFFDSGRKLVVLVGFAAGSLAASSARAQASSSADPSEADQVVSAKETFAAGRARMDAGAYLEAVDLFRSAVSIKNTPGLRYHIGFCLEQASLLLEAQQEYGQAAALLQEHAAADVAALLPGAQARVHRATPRLIVEGLTPGAVVRIDGEPIDAESPHLLNPGRHSVSIAAAGREPVNFELTLEPAEQRPINGSLREAPQPRPAPAEPPSQAHPARSALFWGAAGVAVAGVGVGVTGLVLSQNAAADAQRWGDEVDAASGGDLGACKANDAPARCTDLASALGARGDATTLIFTGFTVGALGAVTALVMHLVWVDAPVEVGLVPEMQTATTWGGARLHVQGRF